MNFSEIVRPLYILRATKIGINFFFMKTNQLYEHIYRYRNYESSGYTMR